MSVLEEIKNLFEKELKKYKKITKAITDKYNEISQEHELLLADVEALDTRLIYVEKKLKITNDFDISNNSTNNIKDLSEFRYQIITRSKAKQLKNKQKINYSEENEDQNSSDNAFSEEKLSQENSKKKNQRKKTKSKEKNKNKRNHSTKNNQENKNKEEFNNFYFYNNKLEQTYNKINPLLIQDNNSFYNNNNIDNNDNNDAMSFKNNKLNNETKSLLSTSENFSEFSFNPQKLQKRNFNNQNQPQKISSIPKSLNVTNIKNIINSDIIKNMQEIELILKSVHNYNKFDDTPTIQAIFQSLLNGDSAQTFHKFCDCEPNVIVVIETNKGKRFGGFTTIGFNSDNELKKDFYAFLFSFDLMKIYKSKKGRKNIFCKENSGPYFGDEDNKDLLISDKCFSNTSFVGKSNGCFLNMNKDYEINEGNSNFVVKKLEIFKLLI